MIKQKQVFLIKTFFLTLLPVFRNKNYTAFKKNYIYNK